MEQRSRSEQLKQKRSFWKQHLERWRSSNVTQKAFCLENGLKAHQFTYWKKRFVEIESGGIQFVPVRLSRFKESAPASRASNLVLIIDRGFRVEIGPDFDPVLLRRLVAALRAVP